MTIARVMEPLWTRSAKAPGKAILFGEHAIVYGRPAATLAIDLPTTVKTFAFSREEMTLDGSPEAFQLNPYLKETARIEGIRGMDVKVHSDIPRASGLGSSAALISAFLTTLSPGPIDKAELARKSFICEFSAQKIGSPADTSTVSAGGMIAIGSKGYGERLWEIPAMEGRGPWKVSRLKDPGWKWVVAYSGLPKATGPCVTAVGERLKKDSTHILDRISGVTEDGIHALTDADRKEVGRLMNLNHELLLELGVGHPRLEEMTRSVKDHVLGVKITGAGQGGSLVALPKEGDEERVAKLFAKAGSLPFVVRSSPQGASLLP
jgi:mevalonate kinase